MSTDRYEDRPSLKALIEGEDYETLRRWWPKLSPRDRQAVLRDTRVHHYKWSWNLVTTPVPVDDDVPEDEESDHAYDVGRDPKVKRWVSRLKRLMEEMPEGVWVHAGDGSLDVYAYPPDRKDADVTEDLRLAIVNARVLTSD